MDVAKGYLCLFNSTDSNYNRQAMIYNEDDYLNNSSAIM